MADQHRRVLLVDDDSELRGILSRALQQRSLIIDEAARGRDAITLLRERSYCVVLLDLIMPEIDGFAVLDEIDTTSADTPVVLVMTGADRSVLERLDCTRIHGVVRKPLDPIEIASIVAACADIRGRGAFQTMALATMLSSAKWIALLDL